MTIRLGDNIRLASRDRWRLQEITLRDPREIDSFEALYNFLEWHRARGRGKSKEAEFLRWLMAREWNRLSPGSGYRTSNTCESSSCLTDHHSVG